MEVATKLHLSSRTIDNITQKIYKKIGISGRQQLVDYCYENKINNYVPQSFFEYSGAFPLI
ncbi:TPA: helix-turn-helix transcriptional regulator, partial [Yersinia enterocolitica]|nr:helix-turn-helix transcriptional regulator [Yersinia enterocolitica]